MTRVLITGVAGFIGSNIAEELIKKGYEVIGVDDFSTGKKHNIKHLLPKIKFKKGDITNLKFLKKVMLGVDYVLHYAALPSVPYSVNHPVKTHEVNVNGTFNVLLSAKANNVRKVIFASSAAVYGDANKLPIKESQELNPLSPYAAHKIIGEQYCRMFYNAYGLRTTIMRYFNVYGPRQDPNSQYAAVVPKFISLMKKGKSPVVFGDGKQTRDFINVRDLAEANILVMNDSKSDGRTYNVSSGKRTSIVELVDEINKLLGTKITPIFQKERIGDIKHSYADVSKVRKELGFRTKISLRDGLKNVL